jgi:hypothetical protein
MKIDRKKLHEIIFEANTTGGEIFDISLIILILISILPVMFDKHDNDALFCKKCGNPLDIQPVEERREYIMKPARLLISETKHFILIEK